MTKHPQLRRELLIAMGPSQRFLLLILAGFSLTMFVVVFANPSLPEFVDTAIRDSITQLLKVFLIVATIVSVRIASSAFSREREQKTYEFLLLAPFDPQKVMMTKLAGSLLPSLIASVLVGPFFVYWMMEAGLLFWQIGLLLALVAMTVVACAIVAIDIGSHQRRTAPAQGSAYLVSIPVLAISVYLIEVLTINSGWRVVVPSLLLAAGTVWICAASINRVCHRMAYPDDLGNDDEIVVDLEQESYEAIGLVVQPDQFPDRIAFPPKVFPIPDDQNPVFRKQINFDFWGQGTLYFRLILQIGMLLALPIMAYTLYIRRDLAGWYTVFVVFSTILTGSAFSSSCIASEGENRTLDLLLTTPLTDWQILTGKLLAVVRVSMFLPLSLCWPILLALLMVPEYWPQLLSIVAYLVTILATGAMVCTVGIYFSTVCNTTRKSLGLTHLLLFGLALVPPVANGVIDHYALTSSISSEREVNNADGTDSDQQATNETESRQDQPNTEDVVYRPVIAFLRFSNVFSPISAALNVPIHSDRFVEEDDIESSPGNWGHVVGFLTFAILGSALAFLATRLRFRYYNRK